MAIYYPEAIKKAPKNRTLGSCWEHFLPYRARAVDQTVQCKEGCIKPQEYTKDLYRYNVWNSAPPDFSNTLSGILILVILQ